eukprot:TRINITY_DN55771_c0_g1_i1.p1 TRINITY_DN55771_c0_g1~~TRINITY_DN55771_c0_g1_i1.p1  ORF type:complete len:252 (-),score=50.27 TRINITY_DN55771_c0_g1_i1:28-783(-)
MMASDRTGCKEPCEVITHKPKSWLRFLWGLVAPAGSASGNVWLPFLLTPEPVLPLERLHMRVVQPQDVNAVKLCVQTGMLLASGCDPGDKHAADVAAGAVGTYLEVERSEELPGGALEATLLGVAAVHLGEREAVMRQLASGEACMVNAVSVTPVSAKPEDGCTATHLQQLMDEVIRLLGEVSPGAALTGPPDAADDFAWWATSRLPLPQKLKAPLLHIASTEERLSMCLAVLRPLSRQKANPSLPLRAKL